MKEDILIEDDSILQFEDSCTSHELQDCLYEVDESISICEQKNIFQSELCTSEEKLLIWNIKQEPWSSGQDTYVLQDTHYTLYTFTSIKSYFLFFKSLNRFIKSSKSISSLVNELFWGKSVSIGRTGRSGS